MNKNEYAHIALTTKTKKLDRFFTYKIPKSIADNIRIGSKVLVPFGRGNKITEGYVFEFSSTCKYDGVKEIISFIEELSLSENQIMLCRWMRKKYLCTISDAISVVTPPGAVVKERIYIQKGNGFNENVKYFDEINDLFKNTEKIEIVKFLKKIKIKNHEIKKMIKENLFLEFKEYYTDVKSLKIRMISLNDDDEILEDSLSLISKRSKKPFLIYEYLKENDVEREDLLKKRFKISSKYIDELIDKNILKFVEEEDFRVPKVKKWDDKFAIKLNFDQNEVFDEIKKNILDNKFGVFLLQGVTGSGKTEVYIKLVKETLKRGKTALILVPEISLTPQTVGKFYSEFGDDVALFHSKLSLGERYDQWRMVKSGEKKIVVGARSAIMAPCYNIGIIILDEEHDSSYKSDRNPKYQTRDVAEYLGKLNCASIILGSATPSMESLLKCDKGEYKKLYMNRRYNNYKLPDIEIVDMRKELEMGNKGIFSNVLEREINNSLDKKEQVILFLNRKGYSTFVKCRECGHSLKCPNCDISLTYHKYDNTGKCSYCGYMEKVTDKCPSCGSEYFKHFGMGTEKAEEITKSIFKDASVARVDGMISSKKGAVEKTLREFKDKKIDILIGTQMISKGLDFSNVTLVGVISADILLNIPDYLASERSFQILTQVSGRAGRGEALGKVFIQTYSPDNFVFDAVSNYDFGHFIKQESFLRKEFKYPPYYKLANIILSSEDNYKAEGVAKKIRGLLDEIIFKNRLNIKEILGPNPAVYSKIKNRHRWQIIIKYKEEDFLAIRKLLKFICIENIEKISSSEVTLNVDIDSTKLL